MCALADDAVLTDDGILDDRTLLDDGVRHDDTVADNSALFNNNACEQHREVYHAVDLAALCYHGVLNLAGGACVMRRHYRVSGVDLPVVVQQIERNLRVKDIHVSFPQGVDGSNVLPVTIEVVRYHLFLVLEHCGDYVLTEILGCALVVFVVNKVLAELGPCEHINTH